MDKAQKLSNSFQMCMMRGSQAVWGTERLGVSKSNVHKPVAVIYPRNSFDDCILKNKTVAWSRGLLFPSRRGALPSARTVSFNAMIW
jgi:hypothetical protein